MPLPPRPRSRSEAKAEPRRPLHERDLLRICGLAAVRALFERDPGRVERLFFEPRLQAEAGAFCKMLARARKPYRQIDAAELARVAGTTLHGGIVAIARPRQLLALDPKGASGWARDGKPLLILDGVGNPHNLGAIARSAAFFGLDRLVLAYRPDQALPSDASYRVAEGGLERLTLYQARLPTDLAGLRPAYRIVGTTLDRRTKPIEPSDGTPVALILGNEEKGLDSATLAACDELMTIPGNGQVQSLNVGAAAAIFLYVLTRS